MKQEQMNYHVQNLTMRSAAIEQTVPQLIGKTSKEGSTHLLSTLKMALRNQKKKCMKMLLERGED